MEHSTGRTSSGSLAVYTVAVSTHHDTVVLVAGIRLHNAATIGIVVTATGTLHIGSIVDSLHITAIGSIATAQQRQWH